MNRMNTFMDRSRAPFWEIKNIILTESDDIVLFVVYLALFLRLLFYVLEFHAFCKFIKKHEK